MRNAPFLLLLAIALPALAQAPYLVRDVNTSYSQETESSDPDEFIAFGNRVFFVADGDETGRELWSTDGNGATLVADLVPGPEGSAPSGLVVFGNQLVFSARTEEHGSELWTTDGTAAGTRLLADVNPGPASSFAGVKLVVGGRMYFAADDGSSGREPWITDGTVAGTARIADLNPGAPPSAPGYWTPMGGAVYFCASNGLWKTDGTAAGTVRIAGPLRPRSLTAAGSKLFLEAFSPSELWEPWVSDGTEAGTHMLRINPGPVSSLVETLPGTFTAVGERVLFLARDATHGREPWISDGTAEGTRMAGDFTPGPDGYFHTEPLPALAFGGRAWFPGRDDAHGAELWSTDGTAAGTGLFADVVPGPESSYAYPIAAHDGKLLFHASTPPPFIEWRIWITDGTAGGMRVLETPLEYRGGNPRSAAGRLYFRCATPLTGTEPCVTDGTGAGTRTIANLASDGPPSSSPRMLTAADGLLYFYATDGSRFPETGGRESSLWRSDGTAAGTFKLREAWQHPPDLTPAGSFVLFKEHVHLADWTISDGTAEGTKPAGGFLARFGGRNVNGFFPFGDTLFANVESSGIWVTTAAPDAPAVRLGSPEPFGVIEVAGEYMFYADRNDVALWRTDGTPGGTYAVAPDLETLYYGVGPLVHAGGTVFFFRGAELWTSDGTFDGTNALRLFPEGASSLTAAGRRVFFMTADRLWMSDGSEAGTVAVTELPQTEWHDRGPIFAAGERVVYRRTTATDLWELWGSDGTLAGTRRLMEAGAARGEESSIEGLVYFAAFDELHGIEPWVTDGTPEGTRLLYDVNPGPASSHPASFTLAGDSLFFSAYTGDAGQELWAFPLADARLSIGDGRAAEGGTIRFTVSLEAAPAGAVTVRYETSDGTATAGQDYEAASGTLTFAAGETAKTIDVRVLGDALVERDETFVVTLRDAAAARVVKGHGAGIIGDDDRAADLGLEVVFRNDSLDQAILVSSAGPSGATDVVVTTTATPFSSANCSACSIPQLAAGASAEVQHQFTSPFEQTYLSATVSARQPDPNPANDTVTSTVNARRTIAMVPAWLHPGGSGTVTAQLYTSGPIPAVTVSDPAVISLSPPVATAVDKIITFTVTALRAGTSKIIVDSPPGFPQELLVTVVAAGESMRWSGALQIARDVSGRFDTPLLWTVTPTGTAPISGARATGTITVVVNGKELARHTLDGTAITFPVHYRSLGTQTYTMRYSGDTNFLPYEFSDSVHVAPGRAALTGVFERPSPDTLSLIVRATGSPVMAPSGSVVLSYENGTHAGSGTLQPAGDGTATAQIAVTGVPPGTTLTIQYQGDALYEAGTQQVRVPAASRQRSVRH